nr:MAG TPA: holin [Caudoviricetes sp.]
MEELQAALINLLVVIVGLAATFLSAKVNTYLKDKGIKEQLESKKNYVNIVVNAMQQLYSEADGDKKLQEAKQHLVAFFNANNIKFTMEELDMLIEAAVKGMKEGNK